MAEKTLKELQEENIKLREEFKKLQEDYIDFASHKIYKKAQNMFLAWITVIALVLGAFGLISVSNIVDAINKRIEQRGVEKIVDEIKSQFIEQHQNTVVKETTALLIPRTEEKIETAIQELIEQIKKAERNSPGNIAIGKALEASYEKNLFYVVVGSSSRRSDLVGEQERVLQQLGSSLKEMGFPELIITDPKDENPNWGLRFDNALTYADALKLREKAVKYGFRNDSYLYRIKDGKMN